MKIKKKKINITKMLKPQLIPIYQEQFLERQFKIQEKIN